MFLAFLLIVIGEDRSGQAERAAFAVVRLKRERPGPRTAANDREFGLGEQVEQVGAGRSEPDFDHPVGHRDDVLDRAQRIVEAAIAGRAETRLERACNLFGGDLAAIAPFGRGQPKDVAQAVVADVPAFGQAADDIAAGIERNEPASDIFQKDRIAFVERCLSRVAQLRLGADHYDARFPRPLVAAGGRREHQQRCRKHHQSAPGKGRNHGYGFNRNDPFSKRLDSCHRLFY